MPTSIKEIRDSYPLPSYNYRVDIGTTTMSFSEVTGLSMAFEVTTYKESRVEPNIPGPVLMQMPAQPTPPTITLKRGVVRSDRLIALKDWVDTIKMHTVEKRDVTISLCDEGGAAVILWKVFNAFPKKLDAPSFTANSNDAAIESMELAADRVTMEKV